MSKHMIISVMSRDRTGIISDITGAIFKLGGDLADLNQSVLCGYLTMILSVTFDLDIAPREVLDEIGAIDSPTQLDVMVREMGAPPDQVETRLPPKTYILTAQGRNRKGLVHSISTFCFRHDINITGLATTRTADTYTMILQLDLSRVASIVEVRRDLQRFAEQSGLHVLLQHHDLFKVTNEIPF